MRRHIFGSIGVLIVLLAIVPSLAIAAPQVFIYTDKGSYQAPETIELSLGGENYDLLTEVKHTIYNKSGPNAEIRSAIRNRKSPLHNRFGCSSSLPWA